MVYNKHFSDFKFRSLRGKEKKNLFCYGNENSGGKKGEVKVKLLSVEQCNNFEELRPINAL